MIAIEEADTDTRHPHFVGILDTVFVAVVPDKVSEACLGSIPFTGNRLVVGKHGEMEHLGRTTGIFVDTPHAVALITAITSDTIKNIILIESQPLHVIHFFTVSRIDQISNIRHSTCHLIDLDKMIVTATGIGTGIHLSGEINSNIINIVHTDCLLRFDFYVIFTRPEGVRNILACQRINLEQDIVLAPSTRHSVQNTTDRIKFQAIHIVEFYNTQCSMIALSKITNQCEDSRLSIDTAKTTRIGTIQYGMIEVECHRFHFRSIEVADILETGAVGRDIRQFIVLFGSNITDIFSRLVFIQTHIPGRIALTIVELGGSRYPIGIGITVFGVIATVVFGAYVIAGGYREFEMIGSRIQVGEVIVAVPVCRGGFAGILATLVKLHMNSLDTMLVAVLNTIVIGIVPDTIPEGCFGLINSHIPTQIIFTVIERNNTGSTRIRIGIAVFGIVASCILR